MRGRFLLRMALLLGLALGAVIGCSNDDNGEGPATGVLSIRVTDAPAQYDQVNLVVSEVAVFRGNALPADSDSVSGWAVVRSSATTINLIALRNGTFFQLAAAQVPSGTYSMMRLRLGAGSNVVVNGTVFPLTVPSGMQSGLKIHGPFTVPNGGTLDLIVDFDASRSIHQTGAGTYILNPVLRVLPSTSTGAISGRVLPDSVETTVFATQAADTVTSTITAPNGRYTLSALPAGTYALRFHPETAYRDTTIAGVVVTTSHTTAVADVQLTPVIPAP